MNDGWEKREAVTDLTILGNAEESHVKKVGGLLASIKPDRRYPADPERGKKGNWHYELVQKNGESITVPGSASINSQLGPDDVGRFVRMEFLGWGNSPNGKFKQIDVMVWTAEPNEDMKAWPRFAEFYGNGKGAEQPPVSEAEEDPDDDLPF